MTDLERIARALESIAGSLEKLANPLVKVDGGQSQWWREITERSPDWWQRGVGLQPSRADGMPLATPYPDRGALHRRPED